MLFSHHSVISSQSRKQISLDVPLSDLFFRIFRYYIVNMWCLQKERFLKAGWEHADALDMMTIYSMLPQDDVAR